MPTEFALTNDLHRRKSLRFVTQKLRKSGRPARVAHTRAASLSSEDKIVKRPGKDPKYRLPTACQRQISPPSMGATLRTGHLISPAFNLVIFASRLDFDALVRHRRYQYRTPTVARICVASPFPSNAKCTVMLLPSLPYNIGSGRAGMVGDQDARTVCCGWHWMQKVETSLKLVRTVDHTQNRTFGAPCIQAM